MASQLVRVLEILQEAEQQQISEINNTEEPVETPTETWQKTQIAEIVLSC